jgi:hypothetical protein
MKHERGLTMLTHAAMLGAVAYLVMLYGLKQPAMMAENRSLILAAVALIYMINFGHKMPFQ